MSFRAWRGDHAQGFKQAFAQYVEGGWHGLAADPAYGGQGLPLSWIGDQRDDRFQQHLLGHVPGLTHGAMSAIHAHGTEEQKNTYLSKLTEGRWTGTMCLTRPIAALTWADQDPRRALPTAVMPSVAARSSSPPASTT
ncbi:acyl-CoA dehydrogenase family protein [Pseudomonas sp. PCH446]